MVISTQMPPSVTHFPQAFSSFRPRHQKVYGAICISSEGRVLLVKGRLSGKWSFPKGHMEPFESGNQCALRELFEEAGIRPSEPYSFFKKFTARDELGRGGAEGYFFYFLRGEPMLFPHHTAEIEKAAWMDMNDFSNLHGRDCNVDINNFRRWARRSGVMDVNHL